MAKQLAHSLAFVLTAKLHGHLLCGAYLNHGHEVRNGEIVGRGNESEISSPDIRKPRREILSSGRHGLRAANQYGRTSDILKHGRAKETVTTAKVGSLELGDAIEERPLLSVYTPPLT
jgi:hypothetical protein